MSTPVIMPQMGESIAEGTITKWLKKVGDTVKRDEPIFEISTDKVDAEIPSPVAGTLLEIKVNEGQTVAINTVVATIGEAGEQAASAPGAEAAAPAPAAAAARGPRSGQGGRARAGPEARAEAGGQPAPAAQAPAPAAAAPAPRPSAPAPRAEPPAGGQVESIEERIRRKSSPLVRKIAQENQIDIQELEGTGIHNRVTKNDVLSYLENRKVAQAPSRGSAAPAEAPQMSVGRAEPAEAPAPRPAIPVTDRDEVVAMTKIRRITAENMILSKRTSAHVTTVFQVDYTNIARIRAKHKDEFLAKNGVKLTYLPFIFRAAIQALKQFPQVNASIDGENIVYHKDVHLGHGRGARLGPHRSGHQECRREVDPGPRPRLAGPRGAGPHEAAQARGDPGRNLHRHEPGSLRLALRHADHPAAPGRDPGRRHDREAARGRHRTRTGRTRWASARPATSRCRSTTA